MCSIPYEFLTQTFSPSTSFLPYSSVIALSSLIFNIIFSPFYSKQYRQNGYDRQGLIIYDYTKCIAFLADNSL